ncbi:actin-like protein 8 [Artibeus jamaicensis]|uniref:actin-like protein 8 n=1 Tax=Artibeus jamaicensis TaxID=9417 RepID=UPI00235A6D07|nr:actin-like protein 8 [Artibeus jamaicensis]
MTESTIVIDHGSGFLKAGMSGWNKPHTVCPNIVNYRPCRENPGPSSARRVLGLGIDIYHPDTFSYPIQRGRILNWEAMERMWSFVLETHKKEHEVSPVLFTEPPLRKPGDRRKTLEIMFESLCVPALLLADELEMSLYATGLLTGVVVDSGYGLTRVQPYYLGRPLQNGLKVLEFAGQDVSAYLKKSLFQDDSSASQMFRLHTADTVQMEQCYVPQDLGQEIDILQSLPAGSAVENTYHLPDGTTMDLTPMQRLAPEMFFSPEVFDLQVPSLSQALVDSIKTCEASLQPLILSHVIACGGNTMYPGFCTRLFEELAIKHLSSAKTMVRLGSTRKFSVWVGASVVAHLSTYKSQWITKLEYDEG